MSEWNRVSVLVALALVALGCGSEDAGIEKGSASDLSSAASSGSAAGADGGGAAGGGGATPGADPRDSYRPTVPHTLTEKTYECTDADDAPHSFTVYRYKNAAAPEVPPEERALSTSVFFRDEETVPLAVISDHGRWSYHYQACTYTWLLEMSDFSQQRLVFDAMPGSEQTDTTRPPMDPPTADLLAANEAQFNASVVSYAQSQLGTTVGNGECWTLAEQALEHAGAHFPVAYIFGSKIGFGQVGAHTVLESASPGDIIQFDAGIFEFQGGAAQAGAPVHTAIVKSIDGNALEVYEQNMPVGGAVREHVHNMSDMVSGGYFIYRAYPLLPSTADE